MADQKIDIVNFSIGNPIEYQVPALLAAFPQADGVSVLLQFDRDMSPLASSLNPLNFTGVTGLTVGRVLPVGPFYKVVFDKTMTEGQSYTMAISRGVVSLGGLPVPANTSVNFTGKQPTTSRPIPRSTLTGLRSAKTGWKQRSR